MTFVALALYSALAGTPKPAAESKADVRAESAAPKKDAGTGLTPLDQSESDADIKLTQSVRQAVMKDDRLSFNAKNVKIISRGGEVTLRGAVNSDTEREVICAVAAKLAGVSKVNDQLEVSAAKAPKTN